MTSRHILITGASSGIGKSVLEKLMLAEDIKLSLVSRDTRKLREDVESHKSARQNQYRFYDADLIIDEHINNLVNKIDDPVDSIVLCAGALKYKPVAFLNRDDLQEMMDINFLSPILFVRGLLKAKKIKKSASIIFVSSVSSRVGVSATLAYASSKAAIESGVRVMAAELASKFIKVNAVCPGLVDTPMLSKASQDNGINIASSAASSYPLGIGKPDDVASLILFLISPENNWITGQSIVIDGGYLLNK